MDAMQTKAWQLPFFHIFFIRLSHEHVLYKEADSLPGLVPGLHCSLMLEAVSHHVSHSSYHTCSLLRILKVTVFRNLLAMATMRRWFCKSWILWTALILASDAALRKPSVAGKSIYFIVTDRFARSGPDKDQLVHRDYQSMLDYFLLIHC